jgi:hypothetical protein
MSFCDPIATFELNIYQIGTSLHIVQNIRIKLGIPTQVQMGEPTTIRGLGHFVYTLTSKPHTIAQV